VNVNENLRGGSGTVPLHGLDLSTCRAVGDLRGVGHVSLAIGPSGEIVTATVDTAPFRATPTGRCIENAFRRARAEPFGHADAGLIRAGKSFSLN
jgi:hypothetical protein